MLKQNALKRIIIYSIALVIMLLLCIFPKNDELNIPSEIVYVDNSIPIYAIDSNNFVARTEIKKTEQKDITFLIDALTINSLTANNLPIGFSSIIPKGTKLLDYSIDNKILKLNFSEEFLNVKLQDEKKMIESLVYTLCELDDVDGIMIFINGEILNKLPNSQNQLPTVLDKKIGINTKYLAESYKNTSKTTIYYISKFNNHSYYIPITKITNETVEPVEVIVRELKTTPIYETNLISYLNASYELKDYEILKDSITMSFDNKLIANLDDNEIQEKVKYTLALSLRDTYYINNIVININ